MFTCKKAYPYHRTTSSCIGTMSLYKSVETPTIHGLTPRVKIESRRSRNMLIVKTKKKLGKKEKWNFC